MRVKLLTNKENERHGQTDKPINFDNKQINKQRWVDRWV